MGKVDEHEGRSEKDVGKDCFPIYPEDIPAIDQIVSLVRDLLRARQPADIRGAAALLSALDRLPRTTPGVSVTLTISTPEYQEGRFGWVDLTITDNEFSLGYGEHFYNPRVGGDTETHTIFETQSGSSWREGNIGDWLAMAHVAAADGKARVEDESDSDAIDWYED